MGSHVQTSDCDMETDNKGAIGYFGATETDGINGSNVRESQPGDSVHLSTNEATGGAMPGKSNDRVTGECSQWTEDMHANGACEGGGGLNFSGNVDGTSGSGPSPIQMAGEWKDNTGQNANCPAQQNVIGADENAGEMLACDHGNLPRKANVDILTSDAERDSECEDVVSDEVFGDCMEGEQASGKTAAAEQCGSSSHLAFTVKPCLEGVAEKLSSDENVSGSQTSSADVAMLPGEMSKNGYIALRQKEDSEGGNSSSGQNGLSNVPKDRGWAWMIVLSCCIMHILAIGSAKSFGVFFVEFLEKFGASKGQTAWMTSVNALLAMSLGPFATSMGVRFGNRVVVIIGGLLYGIGYMLSGFAPNVEFLYVSYGAIAGIGISLVYAPSVVMVAQYFEKRRALANGISVAGSGIGNFVFPPLIRFLIVYFSLQGALLIMGGIFFNLCICGALLRPPEFYENMPKKVAGQNSKCKLGIESRDNTGSDLREITGSKGPVNKFIDRVKTEGISSGESKQHRSQDLNELDPLLPKQTSSMAIPIISIQADSNSSLPVESYSSCSLPKLPENVKVSLDSIETAVSKVSPKPACNVPTKTSRSPKGSVSESISLQDIRPHETRKQFNLNQLLHRQAKGGHQSLQDVRPPRWVVPREEDTILPRFPFGHSGTLNSPTSDSLEDPHDHLSPVKKLKTQALGGSMGDLVFMSIQSIPAQLRQDEKQASQGQAVDQFNHIIAKDIAENKVSCGRRLYEKIFFLPGKPGVKKRPLFDWTLLKNPVFFMYAISVFFATCGYPCIFIIVPANTSEVGLTKDDGALLVSIIGIFDLIGRVFFGWFSDLDLLPKRYGFLSAMIFSGISCLVMPFVTSFIPTAAVCAVFGVFGGSYTALIAVILVESLGVEQLPSAFGLTVLGQGIALFISMPLVGWLRDFTGNWHAAFFYSGLMLITGGAVVLLEPCTQRCLENQEEEDSHAEHHEMETEATAQV